MRLEGHLTGVYLITIFSSVNVKWGKETYKGIELSTDEPPVVFKAQLFTITMVPPDRQKVMLKGIVIKDSWEKAKLKNVVQPLPNFLACSYIFFSPVISYSGYNIAHDGNC